MTPKLLPCPFCGSPRVDVAPSGDTSRTKAVFCRECHAEGPARARTADAILSWNTRRVGPLQGFATED